MFDEQLLSEIFLFIVRQLRAAGILLAISFLSDGLYYAFRELEYDWEGFVLKQIEPAFTKWFKPQFFYAAFFLKASVFPWL